MNGNRKSSGIVRRVDDLGRILIPKEIRQTMRIHEGDPLEISVFEDENGKYIGVVPYRSKERLGQFFLNGACRNILTKADEGVMAVVADGSGICATASTNWTKEIKPKEVAQIYYEKVFFVFGCDTSGAVTIDVDDGMSIVTAPYFEGEGRSKTYSGSIAVIGPKKYVTKMTDIVETAAGMITLQFQG